MIYKVFVVEDEATVRNGIRNQLEENSRYQFCGEASDGELALASLREVQADIIISDIKMPFMDGLQLARIIRKTQPLVKIILISGYEEFEFARQAMAIGVAEYLLKPINARQLFAALDRAAEQILEENRRQTETPNLFDGQEQAILRDHFLDELTNGLIPSDQIHEQASRYQLDIYARYYIVAEAEIATMKDRKYTQAERRRQAEEIWAERDDVIWFFRGTDRLLFILKGDTPDGTNEAVFEAASTYQQSLKRMTEEDVTIGIGSMRERVSDLEPSTRDARQTLNLLLGTGMAMVLSCADLEAMPHLKTSDRSDISVFLRHIRTAIPEDVENLADEYMTSVAAQPLRSRLYLFYSLSELATAISLIIRENDDETEDMAGTASLADDLLSVSTDDEGIREYVRQLLHAAAQSNIRRHQKDPVIRAKQYIRENYADRAISLYTVASHVGFSPSHFSTVFSGQTGHTFIDYLTGVRMDRAKEMLRAGKKTADVAYEVGYGDPRYFNYLFRKMTGRSPHDYVVSLRGKGK